ncbi:MAG: hypothetical protein R3D98_16435 [Candidatus Krumholzibacteriia bacterium]
MPRLLLVVLCLMPTLALAATTATTATTGAATAPVHDASADPGLEVMFDTGAALPLGDLGAGLPHTPTGLGAESGYRLGGRVRYLARGGFFLSPSFTYTEFGDHDGFDDRSGKTDGFGQKFKVRAASIRYGVDLGYLSPGTPRSWRMLAAVGVAAVQQRYHEELVADETVYEASLYDLEWLASVGVRHGALELALEYHGSRFRTVRFLYTGTPADYDWAYAALRLSYALPR